MKNSTIFSQFGPLKVSISGTPELAYELAKDFQTSEESINTDISIILLDRTEPFPSFQIEGYVGKGNMLVGPNHIQYAADKYFQWLIENPFGTGPIICYFRPQDESLALRVLRHIKRAISVEYTTHPAYQRSRLATYSFIWLFMAISLIKKGTSFIHAGIAENDGKALVLSGTSGCGKTSLMLELVNKHGFQYLAEDFGIVDEKGLAHFSPKTISLHHSDAKFGNPLAIKAINDLNLMAKAKWHFLTKSIGMNLMLKVRPEDLTSKIGSSTPIRTAIFLERKPVPEPTIQEISSEEFAKRSLHASMRELKMFYEFEHSLRANFPDNNTLLSEGKLQHRLEEILRSSVRDSDTYCITLPIGASPDTAARRILPLFNRA